MAAVRHRSSSRQVSGRWRAAFSCGNAVEILSLTDLTDLKDYIFDIDFDIDFDLLRAGGGVSHRSHRFKGLYFRP